MNDIGSIAAAGINVAGTLAVTKVATDSIHRTTKGMKKGSSKKMSYKQKTKVPRGNALKGLPKTGKKGQIY